MSKKRKRIFVARVPRSVQGGIRAQLKRSQTPRKWWARKWVAYMEELAMGARLGRGRNYAASGQVFDIDVGPGFVEAKVQGGEDKPYLCRLECETVPDEEKARLVGDLKNRPMLLAQLLVRNLPESVETLFRKAGCPLLPTVERGFLPQCSCPDWSHFCKHVAAVLFLLGEAFEQNPMLLLQMRGIGEEELFGPPGPGTTPAARCAPKKSASPDFWGNNAPGKIDYGPVPEKEGEGAPLVKRLGSLPFWRGESRFVETLGQCGHRAAEAGWRTWTCEPPPRVFTTDEGTPFDRL